MRLISAEVRGLGRLVDTKINLDAKVIAIVGPNEAGKSTLLRALERVDSDEAVPDTERSRAASVDDDTATVSVDFVLDERDIEALQDLELRDRPTRVQFIRRAGGGSVRAKVIPRPRKSVRRLEDAQDVLLRALRDDAWADLLDPGTVYDDPEGDAPRHFGEELVEVVDLVGARIADVEAPVGDDHLAEAATSLADALASESAGSDLQQALLEVAQWANETDPTAEADARLWRRSPNFILFDEEDRALRSAYTFDDALSSDPPRALKNLAGAAQLDLPGLRQSFNDLARRGTTIRRANKALDQIFRDAWKQSHLSVQFEIDGRLLRIQLLENDESVTLFDERSAGLRMFVALTAFLKVHGTTRPPILLIDEAENHLHLDAQADLVNMFVLQESAAKVIYTTHSPACLPPDLGTGIRAVVPRANGQQVSDVKNAFWHSGPGFSPLMVAMGAAAAAFTPARSVVLTEGATEMILLPTLLRNATGLPELPYQVAPGLSEAPARVLPDLDLEAARVAYLVDRDTGGRELKRSLVVHGVPANAICELQVPGVENLLEPTVYREAFNALLAECNSDAAELPQVPAITGHASESSWAKELEAWADGEQLHAPSKVAVANWLVESRAATLSPEGREFLRKLHDQFCIILKTPHAGNLPR